MLGLAAQRRKTRMIGQSGASIKQMGMELFTITIGPGILTDRIMQDID
jgi:hypothetical protein